LLLTAVLRRRAAGARQPPLSILPARTALSSKPAAVE